MNKKLHELLFTIGGVAFVAFLCAANVNSSVKYDLDGNDTITDISSPTFTNSIGVTTMTAASIPEVGRGFIYEKTTKKLYFKNSDGTEYDLTATGSSGSSALGISMDNVQVTSPTAALDFYNYFLVTSTDSMTAIIELDTSTLSGIYQTITSAATTYLTASSAPVTYLSLINAATMYLSITDASTTYLSLTVAATTYLQITDAATTYLNLQNATTMYLSLTDATTIYLKIEDATTTYLPLTDAIMMYLSIEDAATTYLDLANATTMYMANPSTGILSMANYGIQNSSSIHMGAGVVISTEGARFNLSNDTIIDGSCTAKYLFGNGAGITGLAGVSDNLGNHVATMTLNMSNFSIQNASAIVMGTNVVISTNSEYVNISTNLYTTGYISSTYHYGDGSRLTGIPEKLYFTYADDGGWDNEKIPIAQMSGDKNVTISRIEAVAISTTTNATLTFNVWECTWTAYNVVGTSVTSASMVAVTTGTVYTSFSNAVIAPQSGLFFHTDSSAAANGNIDFIMGTIYYTRNE